MVNSTGLNTRSTKVPFKKTVLALSVMAVATAHAQTNTEQSETAVEEVVITGVRQNIINAQQIKRDAETFVDAISAEDIGSLPDASVLEALQRVPGIAIERFAAPNDSDHFSSEGSNITLRGLPQTRTSFNGRDSFSATNGRGLSFEDVSKDLLGSVEVVKNQTADMIEGGISGTVTLNTRKAFDSNGRQLGFSAQANYGDFREEVTPEFSGLYSDIFELSSGELGFLVSYSEARLKFRADGTELGKHNLVNVDGEDVYAPINAGIRSTDTDRFRRGLATSLQYRSDDSRLETTLEYVRSQSRSKWQELAFFSDDQGGNSYRDAVFTDGVFESGTITGLANGFGPQTRESDTRELIEDVSFNIQYQVTDRLDLSFDAQYIQAENENEDLSVFGGVEGGVDINASANGGNPRVGFSAPEGVGQTDEEYFTDPSNYFFRAAMDHLEESEAQEQAFQLDLDYEIDSGIFRSFETGVRYAERDQTTRWSLFNWQNLSEAWNGGQIDFAGTEYADDPATTNEDGSPNNDGDVVNGIIVDSTNTPPVQAVSINNFHRGQPGIDFTGLYIDPKVVSNFENFSNFTDFRRGDPNLAGREGVVDGFYLPSEVNPTNERNSAFYVKLNFGGGDTNRFSGNVGLRYVKQSNKTSGAQTFPDLSRLNGNTTFENSVPVSARPVFGAPPTDVTSVKNDFSAVLPSLNVKYELTDDLILRGAYSQAVSYANLGDLRFNFNIAAEDNDNVFTQFVQISGNPNLQPMEADNYDLSLEWYFDDDSSLTAGVFYKEVTNFFAAGSSFEPIVGFPTETVNVRQPINQGDGEIYGVELGYSHFFKNLPDWLDGFGIQSNYSFLEQDGAPNQVTDPNNPAQSISSPVEGLPLQGLSEHTFNLVAIYDTDVISSRLAYNYRSDYLLSAANVNLGQPVFAESTGTLDGSIFYNVNDSVKVGLTGANLTNENTLSRLKVEDGPQVTRNSFFTDRRYSLVLRVSL